MKNPRLEMAIRSSLYVFLMALILQLTTMALSTQNISFTFRYFIVFLTINFMGLALIWGRYLKDRAS